ncbi:hypothetical protein Hypma_001954 [Hypsizygus marmoreus]|uniref:F-box domain-containing protein n=1 Tax=Hypsizygus marmoreus TaxID=39966 RepID=A0A369JCW2_HYPMA|nr:hypothetical protein Hypma_001954 [Hypsizygus marmoreus]
MESATHRALSIPEVFREILLKLGAQQHTFVNPACKPASTFEYVDNVLVLHENQATLSRVARCCREFSSPALDVLWTHMSSLIPLFKLIGLVSGSIGLGGYCLSGHITPSQLARFEHYARRIRHLDCSDDVDYIVFLRVAKLLQGRDLLPSLLSVATLCPSQLLHLVSTNVRKIHLVEFGDMHNADHAATVLEWVAEMACRLEVLVVQAYLSDILPTIGQYDCLRCLDLSLGEDEVSVDLHLLNSSIFTRRSLQELSLGLGELRERPSASLQVFREIHNLRKLDIRAPRFFVKHALACVVNSPIALLDLTCSEPNSSVIEHQNSLSMQLSQWRDTLHTLSLENHTDLLDDLEEIEPLFELKALRSLRLCPVSSLNLSNGDLYKIAHAWPEMEVLTLADNKCKRPRATIAALEGFALLCPKLRRLRLPLDIDNLPPSPRIMSHKLQSLHIAWSMKKGASTVARHLDAIFPALHSVYEVHERHLPERRLWEEVDKAIKMFQMVRTEDRKRQSMAC